MPVEWQVLVGIAATALFALSSLLAAVVAFFLKRLIDQMDEARKLVHRLRGDLHYTNTRLHLVTTAMRLLMKKSGIDDQTINDLLSVEKAREALTATS